MEARVPNRRVFLTNKALLNSDISRSSETPRQTGIEFVYWHLPATSVRSPVKFTFVITQISTRFASTISSQFLSRGLALSTGALLALGNRTVPGWRPHLELIAKIRAPSFGAAMMIKEMLLSMSSEELSTYPIFYDGWTDIRSVWKPRDHRDRSWPARFGLPRTSTQRDGTQSWIHPLLQR